MTEGVIQGLDCTQPGLPLKPGRCGTFTHDYKRHGTTSLFAALQMVLGRVIGECYPRHHHQEFLRFLCRLDSEFPQATALHLILDNYGTHGHKRVRRWLDKHPRFVLHFIPTSSSWLNLVERWFEELSEKAVRRGTFRSVAELEVAIVDFLTAWNANPKPFVWTAGVEKILAKIAKCKRRLENIEPCSTHPQNRRTDHAGVVAAHASRISARREDARELSASARPRGSFLEKWKVTVSDQMLSTDAPASYLQIER